MTRRSLTRIFNITACCVGAVVLLMSVDALIAVNRLDPVPAAHSGAQQAGWNVDLLQVRSAEASGGLFGSSAVVKYKLNEAESGEFLEVRLRRPLFAANWRVVSLEPK